MHFSSYREFYPKSLITMGNKDRTSLQETNSRLTHWLVSLEGYPKTNQESYTWKVSIYPADSEGTFNWKTPLYRSPQYNCFDDAYDAALLIEASCQDPSQSMIDFIEKAN
ncbi:hypothetical protein HHO41_21415 [Bacillus sp. DNRA2]|uniref:hypothetical protein n=1 Tax=Bacillus sp. DNRA2 TaxID=2723053 RepID=UPI00145FBAE1|nr:hypothetical protein [Bacillus sp. DNRA2]NMD72784.1 hypothetical protein [Bacillus sp. DNRA2]